MGTAAQRGAIAKPRVGRVFAARYLRPTLGTDAAIGSTLLKGLIALSHPYPAGFVMRPCCGCLETQMYQLQGAAGRPLFASADSRLSPVNAWYSAGVSMSRTTVDSLAGMRDVSF
jgi:hypothetical protein